ncbi:MAG TPA: hypothetical protein EYG85_11710, partial [Crocinitomix sp.]|nr:hypothetical protein [Crocinitomix sp.]
MKNVVFILIGFFFVMYSCDSTPSDNNTKNNNIKSDTLKKTLSVEDSLDFFTRQIQTNYNQPRNWYNRAKFLIRQGDLNNALLDMQEVISRDTTTVEYRITYADLLLSKLELEEATMHYKYAITADSLNPLGFLGLGRVYAYLDNPAKATFYLDRAQMINPHLAETYYLEGLIYIDDYYKTKREESWER